MAKSGGRSGSGSEGKGAEVGAIFARVGGGRSFHRGAGLWKIRLGGSLALSLRGAEESLKSGRPF